MQHYLGVAKDTGISEEEIGAIQACVMAVSGGRVMMQFNEARAGAKTRDDAAGSSMPGGCCGT